MDIPTWYNAAIPPMSPYEWDPLEICTTINLENIDSIDTVNMALDLTIKLTLRWYDKDIHFSNIVIGKHNMISNEKMSMLWNPLRDMILENEVLGKRETEKNDKMSVYGTVTETMGGYNPIENRWFNGSSNPIRMIVRMKTTYRCTFDVIQFPFDVH